MKGGQQVAGLIMLIQDVHGVGPPRRRGAADRTILWNLNANTREFGLRYAAAERRGAETLVQAGQYAAVLHYLKAVVAMGPSVQGQADARRSSR
jgi:branched-chain amino acid transport system substrate-binding protein